MRVYVQRQASDTQEYPSLIDTFWRTHTVDGVFPKDEDRRIYATGEYMKDEINALERGGKLRGHISSVGRVLPSRATSRPSMSAPDKSLKCMHRKGGASEIGGCGDDEKSGDDEDDDGESCGESIQVLIQYPKDSPTTCHWGNVCHRGTNCLTEKRAGPTSSLGIITRDCIPDEDSPATMSQRHFDRDSSPSDKMLLGKPQLL
ncbi:hypothetical protein Tco_0618390 [Tanacetum coccineum]